MPRHHLIHQKVGAFQGKLQLRNYTKGLLAWVRAQVKKDKKSHIMYEHRTKEGMDFYFSNQRYLRTLGRKLTEQFVGELKSTRKLHTQERQTGRKVFRVTVLFRLLPLKRGRTFVADNMKYKILTVDKLVHVQDENGKKEKFSKEFVLKHIR
jgi:NMD protein affecting ribosome stability and mRNA decay